MWASQRPSFSSAATSIRLKTLVVILEELWSLEIWVLPSFPFSDVVWSLQDAL